MPPAIPTARRISWVVIPLRLRTVLARRMTRSMPTTNKRWFRIPRAIRRLPATTVMATLPKPFHPPEWRRTHSTPSSCATSYESGSVGDPLAADATSSGYNGLGKVQVQLSPLASGDIAATLSLYDPAGNLTETIVGSVDPLSGPYTYTANTFTPPAGSHRTRLALVARRLRPLPTVTTPTGTRPLPCLGMGTPRG